MQCEVCGKPIFGIQHRVIIEGAKMITCAKCTEFSSGHWEPDPSKYSSKNRQKRKAPTPRVHSKDKGIIPVYEELFLVESFGTVVKNCREKLCLSQEELGRMVSEKASVIRNVESEKMVPDQRVISKLEHNLGIKLLVNVENPRIPLSTSPIRKDITIGDIVHLKNTRRRKKERKLS